MLFIQFNIQIDDVLSPPYWIYAHSLQFTNSLPIELTRGAIWCWYYFLFRAAAGFSTFYIELIFSRTFRFDMVCVNECALSSLWLWRPTSNANAWRHLSGSQNTTLPPPISCFAVMVSVATSNSDTGFYFCCWSWPAVTYLKLLVQTWLVTLLLCCFMS